MVNETYKNPYPHRAFIPEEEDRKASKAYGLLDDHKC